jgi:hypothetical protein
MKADFGRDKKAKLAGDGDLMAGSYGDMLKLRAKKLPEIEETINELLKDYHGEMITIIKIQEDENGKPDGHRIFIGGVGHISTQMALAKAFSGASDELRDKLLESCKDNPKAMVAIAKEMLNEIMEDM